MLLEYWLSVMLQEFHCQNHRDLQQGLISKPPFSYGESPDPLKQKWQISLTGPTAGWFLSTLSSLCPSRNHGATCEGAKEIVHQSTARITERKKNWMRDGHVIPGHCLRSVGWFWTALSSLSRSRGSSHSGVREKKRQALLGISLQCLVAPPLSHLHTGRPKTARKTERQQHVPFQSFSLTHMGRPVRVRKGQSDENDSRNQSVGNNNKWTLTANFQDVAINQGPSIPRHRWHTPFNSVGLVGVNMCKGVKLKDPFDVHVVR